MTEQGKDEIMALLDKLAAAGMPYLDYVKKERVAALMTGEAEITPQITPVISSFSSFPAVNVKPMPSGEVQIYRDDWPENVNRD